MRENLAKGKLCPLDSWHTTDWGTAQLAKVPPNLSCATGRESDRYPPAGYCRRYLYSNLPIYAGIFLSETCEFGYCCCCRVWINGGSNIIDAVNGHVATGEHRSRFTAYGTRDLEIFGIVHWAGIDQFGLCLDNVLEVVLVDCRHSEIEAYLKEMSGTFLSIEFSEIALASAVDGFYDLVLLVVGGEEVALGCDVVEACGSLALDGTVLVVEGSVGSANVLSRSGIVTRNNSCLISVQRCGIGLLVKQFAGGRAPLVAERVAELYGRVSPAAVCLDVAVVSDSESSVQIRPPSMLWGMACCRPVHGFPFRHRRHLIGAQLLRRGIGSWELGAFSGLRFLDVQGVTHVPKWAFERTALRAVNLSTVRFIQANAFYYCWDLAEVMFGKDLTLVGHDAFNSTALQYLDLHMCLGPVELGKAAFAQCYALAWIDLPSVVKLADSVFDWCLTLKSVTLGGVCDRFPPVGCNSAFAGCSIASWHADVPTTRIIGVLRNELSFCLDDSVLVSGSDGEVVHRCEMMLQDVHCVLDATHSLWKLDLLGSRGKRVDISDWSNVRSMRGSEFLSELSEDEFSGLSCLREVDLRPCRFLRRIPRWCFSCCPALNCVGLPKGLTVLDDFAYWTSLVHLDLSHLERLKKLSISCVPCLIRLILPANFRGLGIILAVERLDDFSLSGMLELGAGIACRRLRLLTPILARVEEYVLPGAIRVEEFGADLSRAMPRLSVVFSELAACGKLAGRPALP